jgi:Ca-activated chloride channel family protein
MVSVFGFAACGLLAFLPLLLSNAFSQVNIEPRVRPAPPPDSRDGAETKLRVDVPLVLVPAHVTTLYGKSVADLPREVFRLFEDDIEQTITEFSQEDAPVSVGFVFDASGSMRGKIAKATEAATQFLRTTNPEDEFFLIEFNEKPRLTLAFTQDPAAVERRILRMRPAGRTSLLDAITLALSQMHGAQHLRRAIVILSDGGDNHSRHTESEIKGAIREADVQIYAMGIVSEIVKAAEEKNGPHLLEELARESGGGYFPVENLEELPGICARIGNELRTQYVLGYSPTNPDRDGKYRRLKVTVSSAETKSQVKVFHRTGYYAPAQ